MGILITGDSASQNWIYANEIGTDASGTVPRPNTTGIAIQDGAHDNTIGGTDPTLGNLIAFNSGAGVAVTGDGSVGNRINGNRIITPGESLISSGSLQLDGTGYVRLPDDLVQSNEQSETIEAWFQTTSGGVILGFENANPFDTPGGWIPALYVGTDGRLYGELWGSTEVNVITSDGAVNDGRWHHVALVADGLAGTQTLYLDGGIAASGPGSVQLNGWISQIGTGYTNNWPAAPLGWYPFSGQIDEVKIWSVARTVEQIQGDMTSTLSGSEPGLVAYYPFDEEGGQTAHDKSPRHQDATLYSSTAYAIDLGGDGVTPNAVGPSQSGPNDFQNHPIVVSAADGHLRGWLTGSLPDSAYRIELFASSGPGPGGIGEAETFLGSLDVVTDDAGQIVFDIPFAAPPGRPFITATATDPRGNTSEISGPRVASLESPALNLRATPGQALVFSAAAGDGIVLHDPEAGPLEPAWDVIVSATAGTLRLSSLDGLVGSGDGTGTLHYRGALSALNAALDGLEYAPAPGSPDLVVLSLDAQSDGAESLHSQVKISDGVFQVTTTADSGPGSLRQAILDAENTMGAGLDTIEFAIPGASTQTISPVSPLPALTTSILVDGLSQPGYAGTPLIELSGQSAGPADGLTITGAGVTVRGLAIGGFAAGAGIMISGPGATGDTIEANFIGIDSSQTAPLSNGEGVRIADGAHDNTVGGTDPALGNLISGNADTGVVVTGDSSVSNRILGNRIFGNDHATPTPDGKLQFDGSNYVSLPNELINTFEPEETIEAWFETTSGGVILGYQTSHPSTNPGGYLPSLYVGTDGRLYGALAGWPLVNSAGTVADGRWHHVALVVDGQAGTQNLYLDGQVIGPVHGSPSDFGGGFNQIGIGYTAYYFPNTNGAWYGFQGQIDEVRIWSVARTAEEIQDDSTHALFGTEPGLEAYYQFEEGTGSTAHDLTSNHRDATLSTTGSSLPAWVGSGGQAIDLGGDGLTENAPAPRQGPNQLQNFPVVVTTTDNHLQGWLSGGVSNAAYHLEFFASAGIRAFRIG